MPAGRPSEYRTDTCKQAIECGKEGMGRAEMAAKLDIAFETMRNWEREHPEFLDATTRARQLSQAWWEAQGRQGIWSKEFNANAYSLQVRNRFPSDWRDKQEHEHDVSDPLLALLERIDGRSRGLPKAQE